MSRQYPRQSPSISNRPIAWYDSHAVETAERYERLSSDRLHEWLVKFLPEGRAAALDVGAGSGRDAAWLARRGYEVVAAEPSFAMRAQARRLHADLGIQWETDRLPELATLSRSRLTFDLILLSAVWMHVPPACRSRAFRKLVNLLRPGGVLAMTLRHGSAEPGRGMHDVSREEIERLAREHGAYIEHAGESEDHAGQREVRWTQLIVRLPTDSAGALPLLRHLVLNDSRSGTHKLGLLRGLCQIADNAGGMAREDGDFMAVPLGLVALIWLRLYMPLLKHEFPQTPNNVGCLGLGFAKESFQNLMREVSSLDLRVGMRFQGEPARWLHGAVRDAVENIDRMPATYLTYPSDGSRIFQVRRRKSIKTRYPDSYWLDEPFLASFGEMLVPASLWRAMQRLKVWIEPAIVAEWEAQIKRYAEARGRSVDDALLAADMLWADLERDVGTARKRAQKLMRSQNLHCVWSGKRLTEKSMDIDHCFPWSVWPCSDLWNLMPAHRDVNQREKRARLPSGARMKLARDGIMDWWREAYTREDDVIEKRFWLETRTSLPLLESESDQLDRLFGAINIQRIRLQRDQQVPEWDSDRHIERLRQARDSG